MGYVHTYNGIQGHLFADYDITGRPQYTCICKLHVKVHVRMHSKNKILYSGMKVVQASEWLS
jgi:hypothetical protein